MNEYIVQIKEIEIYHVPVKAKNKAEAIDIAWELLTESDEEKAKYHNDSDGESQVIEG